MKTARSVRPAGRAWSSVPRLVRHVDRVVLLGLALSLVLWLTLDMTDRASPGESLVAGLVGACICLVVDASARAERRVEWGALLHGPQWLTDSVTVVARHTDDIMRTYAGTAVEKEAQRLLDQLTDQFGKLAQGRIERPPRDADLLVQATRECAKQMRAVTNVVGAPSWWLDGIGPEYWQANREALDRGVTITRVIVCEAVNPALAELIAAQRQAGVTVEVVHPRALDDRLHRNLVIWDDRWAWTASMTSQCGVNTNRFVLDHGEVAELTQVFERCVAVARLARQRR